MSYDESSPPKNRDSICMYSILFFGLKLKSKNTQTARKNVTTNT